jgi:uncharacterized protein YjiS (DUF1127 family)
LAVTTPSSIVVSKGNKTMSTPIHAGQAPAAPTSFPFTGSPDSRVVDHQACIHVARTMRALAFIRLVLSTAAAIDRWIITPFARWNSSRVMRKALFLLDDRMLADIGVNRWEIPLVVADAVRAAAAAGAPTIAARTVTTDAQSGAPANDQADTLAA